MPEQISDTNVDTVTFRNEGEFWAVGRGDNLFRLKDTKGFAYLAHLLRHPATEFHVLDLVRGLAPGDSDLEAKPAEVRRRHPPDLGDAGEMLDDRAKAEYRRRLQQLRDELEHAKGAGDVVRAEKAEREIDALTGELSRAVGLRGRSRRAASPSERARQTVTKTIKTAVERIAHNDAVLGDLLARSIKTGTFCAYYPDPSLPLHWTFGFPEPAAPAAAARDASSPGDVQATSPRRTPLVGRESELATLRATIDRALGGRGSVVLLAGEAGVGKTRLATEAMEYAARHRFHCAAGHCYERDDPLPYLPFVEILEDGLTQAPNLDAYRRLMGDNAAELALIAPRLRRVFADIPAPVELPPQQRRCYLFQSLTEVLARTARQRPQLIVLEDLHWADESTLALLTHLAHRVDAWPIVIVGTYRRGYADGNPALPRTLEELIRTGIRPIKLQGLTRTAVADMLHGLGAAPASEELARLIFDETQGNPFFVEEVYKHLLEEGNVFDGRGQLRAGIRVDEVDVPETVRLVLDRRLGRLDERERHVLATAAVIGRSFSFQLLHTLLGPIADDEIFGVIEKAQKMELIVAGADGPGAPFAFAHELMRQTLLAGISIPRRQQLHATVADAIEGLDARLLDERAGEILHHLNKAGAFADTSKLARMSAIAGEAALRGAAFEDALRHFQCALSHQTAGGSTGKAQLLARRSMAERGLGRREATLASLGEALEMVSGLGDAAAIAGMCGELAEALIWVDRYDEAAQVARRGLGHLEAHSPERIGLLATLAMCGAMGGSYASAAPALEEACGLASAAGDPRWVAVVLGARAVLNAQFFRLQAAVDDGRRCEELGGGGSPWQRGWVLLALRSALGYLARSEECARIDETLEPLAARMGQQSSIAVCLMGRTWAEFGRAADGLRLEGDLRRAAAMIREDNLPYWISIAETQLSMVEFFRGDWAAARAHAEAAYDLNLKSNAEGIGAGMLFKTLAYFGERAAATAVLDGARTILPRGGQPNTVGSWIMLAQVIEGLAVLGEDERAAELCPLASELLETGAVYLWLTARLTRTAAGIAAAAARRWQVAEEHFRIALEQADSLPNRLEQAEVRRFRAMMLMERNQPADRDLAQAMLREALEGYTRMAMPRHAAIARGLLQVATA